MLGEATRHAERGSEYLIRWSIFGHHQFHAEIHSSLNKEEGVIAQNFNPNLTENFSTHVMNLQNSSKFHVQVDHS